MAEEVKKEAAQEGRELVDLLSRILAEVTMVRVCLQAWLSAYGFRPTGAEDLWHAIRRLGEEVAKSAQAKGL